MQGRCEPWLLPGQLFDFGGTRLKENAAFFHALFDSAAVWTSFAGSLQRDVRAQRKDVQLLLEEICHVFAAMPNLSDIAVFSLSAHLVGVLRWLATGTQAICEQHSGDALLSELQAIWEQVSLRKVMIDMTSYCKRYIEQEDLHLWSAPAEKSKAAGKKKAKSDDDSEELQLLTLSETIVPRRHLSERLGYDC